MRAAVWTFIEPRDTSITPSDKIARLVAELADAPLVWSAKDWAGKNVGKLKSLDVLFIVNGPYAFCKNLPALAPAVRIAQRVIWVQNDYAIVPPKSDSKGESPFRAAFRERKEAGLPDIEFWTTVEEYVKNKRDRYVNWNAMAYTPLKGMAKDPSPLDRCAIYYGYYRDYRAEAFDRYFKKAGDWMHVASPSKDFPRLYPDLCLLQPIKGDNWLHRLRSYGAGLYIEDKKQHTEYHSPATRFFEMLSAGLPIAFDSECALTFKKFHEHGGPRNVTPYMVGSRLELKRFIKHRVEIAKEQYAWRRDFVQELRQRVTKLMKKVL